MTQHILQAHKRYAALTTVYFDYCGNQVKILAEVQGLIVPADDWAVEPDRTDY